MQCQQRGASNSESYESELSSDAYQEGSSEWRAQKRPSIYRRSRAVIGREPMGVTVKLHAVGSQPSGNMQNS